MLVYVYKNRSLDIFSWPNCCQAHCTLEYGILSLVVVSWNQFASLLNMNYCCFSQQNMVPDLFACQLIKLLGAAPLSILC